VPANVSSELLADDVRQIFADWQEAVTYRQVASTFDPKTETRDDVETDTPIEVVARAVTYHQVAGSAGMYQVGDLLLLVLGVDLPEQPPARTSRIERAGQVYHIVSYERSPDGLVWQLQCRKP
jgi:hypothetical protein